MTKVSSLPKPFGLLKPITWGQMRPDSRAAPWLCDFVLFRLLSWGRTYCCLTALNWWVFVNSIEKWLSIALKLVTELQVIPVKEISWKFDQLTPVCFGEDNNALHPATSQQCWPELCLLLEKRSLWNNVNLTRHLNAVALIKSSCRFYIVPVSTLG